MGTPPLENIRYCIGDFLAPEALWQFLHQKDVTNPKYGKIMHKHNICFVSFLTFYFEVSYNMQIFYSVNIGHTGVEDYIPLFPNIVLKLVCFT